MENNYFEQLKTLGLTNSQIKIYLFLLQNGLSSPPQIAKATGIARTNCYNILQDLEFQGLIMVNQNNNKKEYIAKDPESLLQTIQQKKETIQQILPDLRSLYTTQKNKPSIQFYDGWDQVQQIYWQATTSKEIYAIGSTKRLVDIDAKFFNKFEKRLAELGVVLNDIVTPDSSEIALTTKEVLKGLYSHKTLPLQKGDLLTDVLIWDDNIALVTLKKPIFGTVITNKEIAKTFKIFFKLIWKGAIDKTNHTR